MKATSNKAWTICFSPIWTNLGLGPKTFGFIQDQTLISAKQPHAGLIGD
jgi:hypothetical protein